MYGHPPSVSFRVKPIVNQYYGVRALLDSDISLTGEDGCMGSEG
jgi:hypothetical protein